MRSFAIFVLLLLLWLTGVLCNMGMPYAHLLLVMAVLHLVVAICNRKLRRTPTAAGKAHDAPLSLPAFDEAASF
jgi:uncharacterized protein DUF5670